MPSVSAQPLWKVIAFPLSLSVAAGGVCYVTAGGSLGLYLGAIAAIALFLPPLLARETLDLPGLLRFGAVVDGVAFVWLVPVFTGRSAVAQWLAAYLVMVSFAAALWALARGLRLLLGATAAGAVTTVAAIAWVAWPIWLSPWASARAVAWLAPTHPLMAVNRVFIDQGVWTHERLMYRSTTLGQDVSYALPASIWPCVLLHGIIAVSLLLLLAWRERSPRPGAAAEP